MKIKFAKRHNTHENDCWCDALALATNKDYDYYYERLKFFMCDDGQLLTGYVEATLQLNGYEIVEMELTLEQAFHLFNTSKGMVFQMKHNQGKHIIYVKGNTIYDNVDERDIGKYLENCKVETVAYKKGTIE